MIELLRFLPPRAQAWVLDHGWIPLVLAIFAALLVLYWRWIDETGPYTAEAPVWLDVASKMDTTTDAGYSFTVVAKIPEGGLVRLHTASLAISAQAVGKICAEPRQRKDGSVFYGWLDASRCADQR